MTPGKPKDARVRTSGNADWADFYGKVLASPRDARRALFEKYAQDHGLTFESVRVKFSVAKRKANPEASMKMVDKGDEAQIVGATKTYHQKAEALVEEALVVFRAVNSESSLAAIKDRIAAANGIIKAAETYLRAVGAITPGAPIQINIANVCKTHPPEQWVKDEWKAVLSAMVNNEVAKNELREFARQFWKWRISEP
jgi:hypothetical protein